MSIFKHLFLNISLKCKFLIIYLKFRVSYVKLINFARPSPKDIAPFYSMLLELFDLINYMNI